MILIRKQKQRKQKIYVYITRKLRKIMRINRLHILYIHIVHIAVFGGLHVPVKLLMYNTKYKRIYNMSIVL